MKAQNELDQLFKEKLEGHTTEPKAELWSAISERLDHKQKSKKVVWLRAAVISLLMASSSYMVFQNSQAVDGIKLNSTIEHRKGTRPEPTKPSKAEPAKQSGAQEEPKAQKPVEPKPAAQKKVVPFQQTNSTLNQKLIVFEESIDQERVWLDNVYLDPNRLAEIFAPKVNFKLKYNKPVSEEWAAESQANKQNKDVKERLFAYAADQFNKIRAGETPELIKAPKGKPQLEINLDKIFGNE